MKFAPDRHRTERDDCRRGAHAENQAGARAGPESNFLPSHASAIYGSYIRQISCSDTASRLLSPNCTSPITSISIIKYHSQPTSSYGLVRLQYNRCD